MHISSKINLELRWVWLKPSAWCLHGNVSFKCQTAPLGHTSGTVASIGLAMRGGTKASSFDAPPIPSKPTTCLGADRRNVVPNMPQKNTPP